MTTQQTTPEPTPLLVSLSQAAKLLSVCKRTIQNYVALKTLPARKLGRRTLIPYSALVQFAKRDHDHTTAPELPQHHDHVTMDGGKSRAPSRSHEDL